MKKGTRKAYVYYTTLFFIAALTMTGFLTSKVTFTGDNIVAIIGLVTTLSLGFFGANYGEHRSEGKALVIKSGSIGPTEVR